jgi:hypothetical protein
MPDNAAVGRVSPLVRFPDVGPRGARVFGPFFLFVLIR